MNCNDCFCVIVFDKNNKQKYKLNMKYFESRTLSKLDATITAWMNRNGLFLLRISMGIVFIWFGVLDRKSVV